MAAEDTATLALTRALIQRRSVTPDDAGCQALLAERLAACGFATESMRFGDVDNLYAVRGSDGPMLCFAGHTDVVPTGPEDRWRHPPFDARLDDGVLHGRGTADMKGALAAMVTACERFVAQAPDHGGRIAFLLTSDEEGPAVDGTVRVVEALRDRGVAPDYCVIGEPSSDAAVGDRVRNGRRGSINGRLVVRGIQGHVAYPTLARNPIHDGARLIDRLVNEHWDDGSDDFPPTTFQVSNVRAGTGASNVIPGELTADLNLRFSPALTADRIRQRVDGIIQALELDAEVTWRLSGQPFLSQPGRLREATLAATEALLGQPARLSTSGGTSDGRFICGWSPEVVELGLVGKTIHQVDERVDAADLATLSALYEAIIRRLLPPG
ncbi:MAG: succinyl-diaminopimelate desuccinylase [Pseudomonadota bacterium]